MLGKKSLVSGPSKSEQFFRHKVTGFYLDSAAEKLFVDSLYATLRNRLRYALILAGGLYPIGAYLNSPRFFAFLPFIFVGVFGVISGILLSISHPRFRIPARTGETLYVSFSFGFAAALLVYFNMTTNDPSDVITRSALPSMVPASLTDLNPGTCALIITVYACFGGRAFPMGLVVAVPSVAIMVFMGLGYGFQKNWRLWVPRLIVILVANVAGITLNRSEETTRRRQFKHHQLLEEGRDEAQRSMERVTDMVNAMLPSSVVVRLKRGREVEDAFPSCTVLFSDIVGFTAWASGHPAPVVVQMLNTMFTEFDEIAQERGVDKIKTIGDAYWCATGLSTDSDPEMCAREMVAFALRLSPCMVGLGQTDIRWAGLRIRIGIHTGPLVAGICGRAKPSYDVFGLTSTLANKLEETGTTEALHVSAATRALVHTIYACVPAPPITIEGLGEVQTYWITCDGTAPNYPSDFRPRSRASNTGSMLSAFDPLRMEPAPSSSRSSRAGGRYRSVAHARWGGLADLVTLDADDNSLQKDEDAIVPIIPTLSALDYEMEEPPRWLLCCRPCFSRFAEVEEEQAYKRWALGATIPLHFAGLRLFVILQTLTVIVLLFLGIGTARHPAGIVAILICAASFAICYLSSLPNVRELLTTDRKWRHGNTAVVAACLVLAACVVPFNKEVRVPTVEDKENRFLRNVMGLTHFTLLCVLSSLYGLSLLHKTILLSLCSAIALGVRISMGGDFIFYTFSVVAIEAALLTSCTLLDRALRLQFADEQRTEGERLNLQVDDQMNQEILKRLFPRCVIPRLGQQGAILDDMPRSAVLFFKIGGVEATQLQRRPREVLRILNKLYCSLDTAIADHDIEKIKTIGNVFLVCCGPPLSKANAVPEVATFGLRVLDIVRHFAEQHPEFPGLLLTCQLGAHVGPVVGAVIGSQQRGIYDIFGDTVNTASRMMSTAPPNSLRVSKEAATALQPSSRFALSGPFVVEAKGKGSLETYTVLRACK
eukprot:TRINITY_DN14081_c0_g1_i2.p1 TRINITY_DN14081_c0_g1~~TRINITY_DN14081_c0_g1_i2.p1  ORF type:complete len:1013 (+),score=122.97 TRINITY_DN14081_c0_g1_i2:52-3039(+)